MLKSLVASFDHRGGRGAEEDINRVPLAAMKPPPAQLRQAADRIAVRVRQ